MGIEDIRDALIIRERDLFLLTDPSGNVPPDNRQGFGLYHADTRHLSVYDFSFRSAEPVVLLSTAELGFAEEQVLTNPRMESEEGRILARGTIEVRRQRVLADVLEETLRVTNYNVFPVTLELVYRFGADFADIFEVRGQHRERRGRLLEPVADASSITYAYEGLDGRTRETHISFSQPPAVLSPQGAVLRMTLPRRASATFRLVVAVDGLRDRRAARDRLSLVWRQYQTLDGGMHPGLHRQRVLQQGPGPLLRRTCECSGTGAAARTVSRPLAPPGSTRFSAATAPSCPCRPSPSAQR